ncbi:ATP-dependent DNA helicase [Trichonephila clavipes]|nr:ATP-dependent DNA helicase [Trichonephila clavipes]
MKVARFNEMFPQAELRSLEQAECEAAHRAAETPELSKARRRCHAEYLASQRAAETPEQSQARRLQHATYMASQRDTETIETAESRKRAVAERAQQRRLIFTKNTWGVFDQVAFEYDETLDYESHKLIKIEVMNKECRFYGTLKWREESAGMCCSGGVALPSIDEPVEPLKKLFSHETDESRRFLKNIRKYNTCFHMTPFGVDNIVSMKEFCPTFTIQGQIYHIIDSLLLATNTQPKFLQVYFMGDKDAQVNRRSEYVQDRVPRCEYERRFNAPTTNEIAAVVVRSERTASRDIVIQAHDGRLNRVPDTHRFYNTIEYPIFFWKGQEGYSFDIPQIDPFTKQPIPNKKVSGKDFYAYHMMVRRNNFNLLLRCRLLFHQFLVDMYVKVESESLRFIALNQTKLRAENNIHLQDAIRNDAELDGNSPVIICK